MGVVNSNNPERLTDVIPARSPERFGSFFVGGVYETSTQFGAATLSVDFTGWQGHMVGLVQPDGTGGLTPVWTDGTNGNGSAFTSEWWVRMEADENDQLHLAFNFFDQGSGTFFGATPLGGFTAGAHNLVLDGATGAIEVLNSFGNSTGAHFGGIGLQSDGTPRLAGWVDALEDFDDVLLPPETPFGQDRPIVLGLYDTFYTDGDGDTFGLAGTGIALCSDAVGYSRNNRDCDDGNPTVNPGASELCNSVDDDCNGIADEFVTPDFSTVLWYADEDEDTYYGGVGYYGCDDVTPPSGTIYSWGNAAADDCNDQDPAINPCLLYTSPSPRDATLSRMPSSA